MIIAKSPLRITLGGGGTDLSSYYREYEGFVISAAINKFVYVSFMETFFNKIILKYSKMETVENLDDIKHPIIRESLKYLNFKKTNFEITSFADIPAGTGLGSSGSFTTALLMVLSKHLKIKLSKVELAELACNIEINKLKEPIGKQDQYIAALGGLTILNFHKDHLVTSEKLKVSNNTIIDLQENLLLFFTGLSRSSSSILNDQKIKSEKNDLDMINNLHYIKKLGYKTRDALLDGKTKLFGELLNEHWKHKKKRSSNISNAQIDEWYEIAIKNGAIGGKVVGAGGGGFFLFYSHDRNLLRKSMIKLGLQEVRFKFEFQGTKTIMK